MLGVGVKASFSFPALLDIIEVALHPFFEVLLGASYVGFSGGLAFYAVYDISVTTCIAVVASCSVFGAAVAWEGLAGCRYHVAVNFAR